MRETSIVIPCYNEEKRFQPEAFRKHSGCRADQRFVFVDDGSTDQTADVLAKLCAEDPEAFALVQLDRNYGKAEAVRRGVNAALADGPKYVGYWDADLATPLNVVAEFRSLMEERPHVDLVLGSRVKLLGRDVHRRAWRHYLGRCFATAASLVLGIGVYDTQCGAKLFRVTPRTRAAFEQSFRTSWIFDVELLARLLQDADGVEQPVEKLCEFPLQQWRDVAGSKLKLRELAKAAVDLLTIHRCYHPRRLRRRRPDVDRPDCSARRSS